MDQKIKARWVKALRSGKYKQGKNVLRDGNTYCCLGVLCDLYSKTKGSKLRWSKNKKGVVPFGTDTHLPPLAVSSWAGINEMFGNAFIQLPGGKEASLSSLNDGDTSVKRRNFKQIADLIEAQL